MVRPSQKPVTILGMTEKSTTEPTCTANGVTTFTCIVCGKTKTRSIKATGHSYGEYVVVKEPTSTEKGLKSKTCSAMWKSIFCDTWQKPILLMTNTKTPTNSDYRIHRQISITTKKIKLNRRKLTLKRGKSFKFKGYFNTDKQS